MRLWILWLLITTSVSAQTCPTVAWTATYVGRGASACDPRGLAVDAAGNVYVTGNLYYPGPFEPVTTLKFNSSGQLLWAAEFVGPANYTDRAHSLAVDAEGNVYVVEETFFDVYDTATLLIKYNGEGQRQWTALYNPTPGEDWPFQLKVDPAGNPWVLCRRQLDHRLIRLSPDGTAQWSVLGYSHFGFDGSGNLYVANCSTGSVATVRKFDPTGSAQWAASHVLTNQSVRCSALLVDAAGYSHLIARGKDPATGRTSTLLVVKFDPTGGKQWAKEWQVLLAPTIQADRFDFQEAALDSDGGIVLIGSSSCGAGFSDVATLKLDSTGHLLWAKRHNGSRDNLDFGYRVLVDAANHIITLGGGFTTAGAAGYLTRLNADGGLLWADLLQVGFLNPYDNRDLHVAVGPDHAVHTFGKGYDPKTKGWFYLLRKYALPEAAPAGRLGAKTAPVKIGSVPVGTGKAKRLKLSNASSTECLAVDITVSGGAFCGGGQYLLPPKGKLTVPITFSPSEVGAVTGTLTLATSDPLQPVVDIPLLGVGR